MSKHPPPQEAEWPEGAIFTVGHSTPPIERFIALLHAYGIAALADIRTVPRSRHNRASAWNADHLPAGTGCIAHVSRAMLERHRPGNPAAQNP
jgi:hypothetical protein